MNIKDILAKIKKGETLTEAEQAFLDAFDLEKLTNDAAAAARRKAEEDAKKLKQQVDELKAERDKAKADAEAKAQEGQTESQKLQSSIEALTKQVGELTKAKAEAEANAAKVARSQTIRDAAKAAGIVLAPKTVSEKLFFQMLEASLDGVDITNADLLKGALESFKTENPGIITAGGVSGSGLPTGQPTGGGGGKNPFKEGETFNLTEQMKLLQTDPEKARSLAAEAGVKLD